MSHLPSPSVDSSTASNPVPRISRGLLAALTTLWVAAVCTGFFQLTRYAQQAGASRPAPPQWPAESRIRRADGRATLLLFAHPRCPCTRASIRQLARVLAAARIPVDCQIVFSWPAEFDDGWERTGLWDLAAAISGLEPISDRGGHEAERFAARTSGLALLYSAAGELRFRGGLTSSRGHEGDSVGSLSLTALLGVDSPSQAATPTTVYGCPLQNPETWEAGR